MSNQKGNNVDTTNNIEAIITEPLITTTTTTTTDITATTTTTASTTTILQKDNRNNNHNQNNNHAGQNIYQNKRTFHGHDLLADSTSNKNNYNRKKSKKNDEDTALIIDKTNRNNQNNNYYYYNSNNSDKVIDDDAIIDDDIILRRKVYCAKVNKWSAWENLFSNNSESNSNNNTNVITTYHYPLGYNGSWDSCTSATTTTNAAFATPATSNVRTKTTTTKGILRIHRNIIPTKQQLQKINQEILFHNTNRFRKYKFQGVDEPRIHLMLHEDATNDFDQPQPGYKHGHIFMKAHSMDTFPNVTKLSNEMKLLCCINNVITCPTKKLLTNWNAGINIVYYRNGYDKIGYHSDDDQNETTILVVNVTSCNEDCNHNNNNNNNIGCHINNRNNNNLDHPRKVIIKTWKDRNEKSGIPSDGDEVFELYIRPGDGYEMDGLMQRYYVHGLERDRTIKSHRLSIVFRNGDLVIQNNDSGTKCLNILPRIPHPCYFGRNLSDLKEGSFYDRYNLLYRGYHRMLQSGVSGSKKDGCDAIVIGERYDTICLIEDSIANLTYVAETYCGAISILKSALENKPIRVFRSTKSHGVLKPVYYDSKLVFYRYDGLYRVMRNAEHYAQLEMIHDGTKGERISFSFYFHLERVEKGCANDENALSIEEFQTKYVVPQPVTFENLLRSYSPIPVVGEVSVGNKEINSIKQKKVNKNQTVNLYNQYSLSELFLEAAYSALFDTEKLVFKLLRSNYVSHAGFDAASLSRQVQSSLDQFRFEFS